MRQPTYVKYETNLKKYEIRYVWPYKKKNNQATTVATTTREKKIHRIAKMRGKKNIQITNNTMIYSAPGSLSQQLRSCELFARLFNSINIQFSFSNFKLAARLAEQDIKKCKKNVWHSPLPFSRCCDYIVVCAWKLHADQSRWNIFLVLFFHYFVIHFSWDWFLLERRFTRITDCSITRLSI